MATGKQDYFSWFPAVQIASHPKADFAVDYSEENCLGCHQGAAAHGEQEPIAEEHTCFKCHRSPDAPGALWGRMHPRADLDTQPAVFAAATIYQGAIAIGVILMVAAFVRRGSKHR